MLIKMKNFKLVSASVSVLNYKNGVRKIESKTDDQEENVILDRRFLSFLWVNWKQDRFLRVLHKSRFFGHR
jgi:hypothetical protein